MDPPVADTVAPPVGGSTSTPVPHLTPPHAVLPPDLQGEGRRAGGLPPAPRAQRRGEERR
uniref:Uncharacterized protein n=1 Tax=Oryza barthii TaxID=65489 RepID=A0A0D3HR79_9ORYZ